MQFGPRSSSCCSRRCSRTREDPAALGSARPARCLSLRKGGRGERYAGMVGDAAPRPGGGHCCRTPLLRERGLTEPVFEPDRAESPVVAGKECALVHLDTVAARARVSDHFTRIVACAETPPDHFVETKLLGPGHFYGAILGRPHGNPRNRFGDIVSRHGLDEHRCQSNRRTVGGGIGDAFDKLEELRRVDDRIWDRGFLIMMSSRGTARCETVDSTVVSDRQNRLRLESVKATASPARGRGHARRGSRRPEPRSLSGGCPPAVHAPCPSAPRSSWRSNRPPTRRRW